MTFRVAVIGLAMAAGVGVVVNNAAVSAAQAKTQWDGVYTDAQAARGDALYAKECATCHGANLEGGAMAPPLIGGDFSANWVDLTVGELFERIRISMPAQDPGSLSRQQNADIVAFMFKKEGAPAGKVELPTQADALNALKYAKKP